MDVATSGYYHVIELWSGTNTPEWLSDGSSIRPSAAQAHRERGVKE
jgi:hypothetical protein